MSVYAIFNPQSSLWLQSDMGHLILWRAKHVRCGRYRSAQLLSHVQLLVTPWTVAWQSPLSMRFFQQEYWSGSPFPSPGDITGPGIERVPRSSSTSRWTLPLHHLGSPRDTADNLVSFRIMGDQVILPQCPNLNSFPLVALHPSKFIHHSPFSSLLLPFSGEICLKVKAFIV